MERHYYSRGKKITVNELLDVLAVKIRGTDKTRIDISAGLGTRTSISRGLGRKSRLVKEEQAFERAGYVFLKPKEEKRFYILNEESPDIINGGRVFTDNNGHIRIETGRMTIKFKPDTSKTDISSLIDENGLEITREFKFSSPPGSSLYQVRLKGSDDLLNLSVELSANKKIAFAEPAFDELIEHRYRPPDPRYDQQWQWKGGMDIEEAWNNTKGEGVKVAVVDNGMDISNPELSKSLVNAAYFREDGNEGAVLVEDTQNFPDGDHGTFCSGMAIAKSDNGEFGCGAANNASFIAMACLPDTIGTQETLARAIAYAADPSTESLANSNSGADVISCSLGPNGTHWTMQSILEEAINFAVREGRGGRGTPIFWAVDNTTIAISEDEVCSHPKTIAVGRCTKNDKEDGSAYGPELDFLAPGVGVYNVYSGGRFGSGTGTSYAAPCAAGIGALVIAVNKQLSWRQVRQILRDTCDKIGNVNYNSQGHHNKYGYGRINAATAIRMALENVGGTGSSKL